MSGETPTAGSYLVECYWPGVKAEEVDAAAGRAQRVAEVMREQGSELRFLGSIFVVADEIVFWLFDGREGDIRALGEQAGVRFERILESLRIDGNQQEEEEEK